MGEENDRTSDPPAENENSDEQHRREHQEQIRRQRQARTRGRKTYEPPRRQRPHGYRTAPRNRG